MEFAHLDLLLLLILLSLLLVLLSLSSLKCPSLINVKVKLCQIDLKGVTTASLMYECYPPKEEQYSETIASFYLRIE